MFPGLFAKAAALVESVIQRHPFVDGNKRTSAASAIYLLRRHGYRLMRVTNARLVALSLNVAAHRTDTEDVGSWFEEHTELV